MKSKRKTLIRKLDDLFSKYIRNKYKTIFGVVQCYTCGVFKLVKDIDAGHYIKRGCFRTRWDERNVRPQCRGCNRFNGGAMDEYALHLIKDYDEKIIEELMKLKHMPVKKHTIQELEDMVEFYRNKLKTIE